MNQLLFEARSLVGIVSSIIRQDDLHIMHSRLDWGNIFRLADYHNVANVVHLGILGYGDKLPEKWKDRFFERYQESLLFNKNCKNSIDEVLTWLDMRDISCTILTSESLRDYYQIPEVAANSPIEILLDDEDYFLAKGYLIDLGYEADQEYKGMGELFRRLSGVSVVLYQHLTFKTAKYRKHLSKVMETACEKEPYNNILMLPPESEFLFRMAEAAYRYTIDELTLREVMDLLLFYQVWNERIDMADIMKSLAKLQVDGLSEKILRISHMWFGKPGLSYFEEVPEDMSAYDVLENRLLTKGVINNETDPQAIKLKGKIQKEMDRDGREDARERQKEKLKEYMDKVKKKMKWVFPDFHYMTSIYPSLEKLPVLLPLFWIMRDIRLLLRMIRK